jgi:hypothetical protein
MRAALRFTLSRLADLSDRCTTASADTTPRNLAGMVAAFLTGAAFAALFLLPRLLPA